MEHRKTAFDALKRVKYAGNQLTCNNLPAFEQDVINLHVNYPDVQNIVFRDDRRVLGDMVNRQRKKCGENPIKKCPVACKAPPGSPIIQEYGIHQKELCECQTFLK